MQHSRETLPLKLYALGCLVLMGIVFYSSYGLSNWLSAQRMPLPEIFFEWERHIPFVAWTIVPYWSLNLFYAAGFFLCRNRAQVRFYMAQLLCAQGIAILFFLIAPLQFSWPKPATTGLSGWLFASLGAVDQPYNQAPSLHIMLVLIVGRWYWHWLRPAWRYGLTAWLALIALSVLTTYQHHFIDIPAGLLAGAVVLWLFPWHRKDGQPRQMPRAPAFARWATFYAACAIGLLAMASAGGGAWLWCVWPAASCFLLALCYSGVGAQGLQKQPNGIHSLAASLLLDPYWIAARLNMAYWLRGRPLSAAVPAPNTSRLHIGSILAAQHYPSVIDVCAEFPTRTSIPAYYCFPLLDMVPPDSNTLRQAADAIQQLLHEGQGTVLVCCALGYGRSAAVALTWLLRHGGCQDLPHALALLQQARPQMVLAPGAIDNIVKAAYAAEETV